MGVGQTDAEAVQATSLNHPPHFAQLRHSDLNLDRINQGMHQFSRFENWPPPTLNRDARPLNNQFCNNYRVTTTRQCLFNHTRTPALSTTCKPPSVTMAIQLRYVCTRIYVHYNLHSVPRGTLYVQSNPASRRRDNFSSPAKPLPVVDVEA